MDRISNMALALLFFAFHEVHDGTPGGRATAPGGAAFIQRFGGGLDEVNAIRASVMADCIAG